jgi:hypothetical protein
LAQLNVGEVAALVGQLAPEVQRAVEDDLGAYPSMCTKLRCGSATACLYVDGGRAMCYSRFGIGTGVTAGVLMRV